MKKIFLNYFIIFIFTIIYSAGVGLFLDPNHLAPGGVTGIAIVLNSLIPIETGTLILILNIPILMLGAWQFGIKMVVSTLYAIVLISGFTNVWSRLEPPTDDKMLAVIAGSALVAVAVGVIFKCDATTGGMDIIVKILRRKYKHIKTGAIFWMLDAVVVILSGIVFKDFEAMLYATIGVLITSWILDLVLYGRDEAKLYFIISSHPHNIGKALMERLEVGVTYLDGSGAYFKNKKEIVMCVVKKHQSAKLEEFIKEIDIEAFTIVTSANEIFGEGFKNIAGERL